MAGESAFRLSRPRFNPMTERQKQMCVWEILRRELGPDAIHVTFILAYGTDEEIIYPFD